MNAVQLRQLLADVPDKTEVVKGSSEHEYRKAGATFTTALIDKEIFTEDFAGGPLGEKTDYGVRVNVLLIS